MNKTYFYSDAHLIVTSNVDKIDFTYTTCNADEAMWLLNMYDQFYSWLFWNDTDLQRVS
jgi:hypothetical protein